MALSFEERQILKLQLSNLKKEELKRSKPQVQYRQDRHIIERRQARLTFDGLKRIDDTMKQCVDCLATSHRNTNLDFFPHTEDCPRFKLRTPKVKRESSPKEKEKYQKKVERQGLEGLRKQDRERYRRILTQEGWVVSDDETKILCPSCRFVAKLNAVWRHYSNCTSKLRGRRVSYPAPYCQSTTGEA